MVEFLKNLKQNNEILFRAGEWYPSMVDPVDRNKIRVCHPLDDSEHKDQWSTLLASDEGRLFRTLKRTEMTTEAIIAENKVLI